MFADDPVPVTFSAGVAGLPYDGPDAARLLGAADARLYEAKHRGRNRVVSHISRA
jgi:PleD family two-component response regulator